MFVSIYIRNNKEVGPEACGWWLRSRRGRERWKPFKNVSRGVSSERVWNINNDERRVCITDIMYLHNARRVGREVDGISGRGLRGSAGVGVSEDGRDAYVYEIGRSGNVFFFFYYLRISRQHTGYVKVYRNRRPFKRITARSSRATRSDDYKSKSAMPTRVRFGTTVVV